MCFFTVLFSNAQPGANDPSFNVLDDGTYGDGLGVFDNLVFSIPLQSDGKIIIGGSFTRYNGTSCSRIARLNADGSLDATFNPGTGADNLVFNSALQADGKIIIVGTFQNYNGTARSRIARLNADGSLDATFNPGSGANNSVFAITLQADGKILIGGAFTSYNGTAINRITRLNADGSLDASFDPGAGANSQVNTITLQSDGKIIIGGTFTNYLGTTFNRIARLNANGSLDTGFDPGMGTQTIETSTLQTDGKIIIGGQFTSYNGTTINRIARVNTNGSLDATFNPGLGAGSTVRRATLQADGKIIIVGEFTTYNGTAINRIARLNADGSLDDTFNPGSGANNSVRASTPQSDGKIIIGGQFTLYNGSERNRIARLNADGSLDATFNPGAGANKRIWTTTMQVDGKIIIGGEFNRINGVDFKSIARLNADGSLDATFNPGTGANGQVFTSTLLADGKIIIGGGFSIYNGTTRGYMARLNADGSLDAAFPTGGNGASSSVTSISFQADGKIIIGGIFFNYNGTSRNRIARLNADGSLDATFNYVSGVNSTVWTSAVQADGKIIIGGEFTTYNSITRNRIARLNADGTFDNDFNMGTGFSAIVNTTAVQADGKILIGGGFTNYNGTTINRIARLNTDGTLDDTFNFGGSGANSTVNTIALQADGKIIIGGNFTSYNGTARSRIARLNADGSLDTGFDPGTGATGAISEPVRTATLQDDGKIIIGGDFNTYNGVPRNRVARIIGDGTMSANPPTWTGAVSSVWVNDQNWLNFIIPEADDEAIIPNEGVNFEPIIEGTVSVAKISIDSERILTINSSGSLTVSGVLTNDGVVTVNSGGALVQTVGSTIAGTGTYNVQRQIPAGPNNAFRFIGSPISNISAIGISGVSATGVNEGQVTPMTDCNPNFVAANSPYGNILELRENPAEVLFNCAQSLWFVKSAGSLVNGRGYAMKANGGQIITFSGSQVNNTSVEISGLARQAGTVEDHLSTQLNLGPVSRGWHLLSNPFPSPIEIPVSFLSDQGFDNQIQLWNSATGQWEPKISENGNLTRIAVGQGFQVRRSGNNTSGNTAATLTLTNELRRAFTGVDFFSEPILGDYRLSIKVNGNNKTDHTTVFFQQGSTPAFDSQYDVNKFVGDISSPALFTLAGMERMAYNGLPLLNEPITIPMVFYPGTNGTYTLDFSQLETLPSTAMVYLEDKKTGIWTNVRAQNAYTFTSVTSDNIQRFNIHFEPPVNIGSIGESCLLNDGSIIINNPSNETWSVTVVNNGSEVYQSTLSQGTTNITNLSSGNYNLNFTNNTYTVSEEIIIEAGTPIEADFILSNENFQAYDIINATVANPLEGAIYTWYLNELFAGDGLTTSFAISDMGTYTIGLDAVLGNCKSSSSGSFQVEETTSISNLEKDDFLRVYPNPANEMATIVWEGRANKFDLVRVMDISGRTVQLIQIGGRTQGNQLILDLSVVSEGLYLISLEGQDVKKTVKVTVVH